MVADREGREYQGGVRFNTAVTRSARLSRRSLTCFSPADGNDGSIRLTI
jgi:hypothetical protein